MANLRRARPDNSSFTSANCCRQHRHRSNRSLQKLLIDSPIHTCNHSYTHPSYTQSQIDRTHPMGAELKHVRHKAPPGHMTSPFPRAMAYRARHMTSPFLTSPYGQPLLRAWHTGKAHVQPFPQSHGMWDKAKRPHQDFFGAPPPAGAYQQNSVFQCHCGLVVGQRR